MTKKLRKAVEWGCEQQKKILEEKSERLTKSLIEQMTPLILERSQIENVLYNFHRIMPFVESTFSGQIRLANPMHQDVGAS